MAHKMQINLRAASSVIVARKSRATNPPFPHHLPRNSNFQVLMVKRKGSARFFAGAHVFPGGVIEKVDTHDRWLRDRPHQQIKRMMTMDVDKPFRGVIAMNQPPAPVLEPSHPLYHHQHPIPEFAFRVGGIREVFEESNILLASKKVKSISKDALKDWRAKINKDPNEFLEMEKSLNLNFEIDKLLPFAHWITPFREKYRYNTMFYLSVLHDHDTQEASEDQNETTCFDWFSPQEALKLFSRGEISLAPPTWHILDTLSYSENLEDLVEMANRQSILGSQVLPPYLPHLLHPSEVPDEKFPENVIRVTVLPGDRLYPNHNLEGGDLYRKFFGGKNRVLITSATSPETNTSFVQYTSDVGVNDLNSKL